MDDFCFVGYREVGSIPEELLHSHGGFLLFLILLAFWLHNLMIHKPFWRHLSHKKVIYTKKMQTRFPFSDLQCDEYSSKRW
jgi:hypothetical protein